MWLLVHDKLQADIDLFVTLLPFLHSKTIEPFWTILYCRLDNKFEGRRHYELDIIIIYEVSSTGALPWSTNWDNIDQVLVGYIDYNVNYNVKCTVRSAIFRKALRKPGLRRQWKTTHCTDCILGNVVVYREVWIKNYLQWRTEMIVINVKS